MWDIKLTFINLFLILNNESHNFFFFIVNFIDPFLYNGFFFFNLKIFYQFIQNITLFFGIKFLLSICFLILIRGGTPRYRYDYLTKLGWLKFLGFIISVFFFSVFFFFYFLIKKIEIWARFFIYKI